MNKILITGATGFIGTNFVKILSKKNKVTGIYNKRLPRIKNKNIKYIKCDLQNLTKTKKIFSKFDIIFHAAGAVSAAKMTNDNPISAITTNLILTARVLEAAMVSNVKKILIFSSGVTGYPYKKTNLTENDFWKNSPPNIYFGYGWMRRYLEILSEFVNSKSSSKVYICRPSAVYGEFDDFNDNTSHVIPALIKRAINRENPFIVWGTGNEERDFLYVDDLIYGCIKIINSGKHGKPYNIVFGKSIKIKEAVSDIFNSLSIKKNKAKIIFDKNKPVTVKIRKFSNSRAKNEINFQPKIKFQQGIKKTIAWYKKELNGKNNI